MEATVEPPPTRYHDLTGKVFGRLTILSYAGKAGKESLWLSRCKCGVEKVVRYNGLMRGSCTSCGCYRREVHAKRRARPKGHERTFNNPLYRIWQSMKTRCYNEKNPNYARYGAKGIRICQRWLDSFDAFVDDMGPPPDNHSIDRIDPYGDYSPKNCRWATRLVQSQNQKRTRLYQWQGESLCLTEVARRANVDYYQVYGAVIAGKSIEEAVQSASKPFTERARSLNPSLPPKSHASTPKIPRWRTFRQTLSDQNAASQPEGQLGVAMPVRVREPMRGIVSEPQGEARPVVRVPEEGQAVERLPQGYNLTGQTFSRLKVLSYAGRSVHTSLWLCRCSCGTEKVIRYDTLTRGKTASCGCLRKESLSSRGHKGHYKRSPANPLWRIYQNMASRHKAGKTPVCNRWLSSFDLFVQDVGPRPDGTRLSRIERDFPFQPDNFIWKAVAHPHP